MSDNINSLNLTTAVLTAWLDNPNTRMRPDDVPGFMRSIHEALGKLDAPVAVEPVAAPQTDKAGPAAIRKSLASPDAIVSFVDGRPYKTLGRHLRANGLTPAEYRDRYGLPADYPMTAPAYSAARSEQAKALGLGRKPKQEPAAKVVGGKPTAKSRMSVAEAKRAAKAHLGGE